jgi:hypothetical protein
LRNRHAGLQVKVGQVVEAVRSIFSVIPPSRYDIVRLMPPTESGNNQCRIKSLCDGHERVVKDSDLTANPFERAVRRPQFFQ